MPDILTTFEHFTPPLHPTIFREISAPRYSHPSTLHPEATPPDRHPCYTPPITRTKVTASDLCASTPALPDSSHRCFLENVIGNVLINTN